MTPFALSGLLISLTCFPLAAVIWWNGPRTPINRLMIAFNAVVGIWGLGTLGAALARNRDQALLAWQVAHGGGVWISILFYHLSVVLCQRGRPNILKAIYIYGDRKSVV